MQRLPGKSFCTLCEDWTSSSGVIERDLASQRYEQMSQHVQPGLQGIRTKRQYQRLLKSRKLTDDITPKEVLDCWRNPGKRDRIASERWQRLETRLRDLAYHVMH